MFLQKLLQFICFNKKIRLRFASYPSFAFENPGFICDLSITGPRVTTYMFIYESSEENVICNTECVFYLQCISLHGK